MEIIEIIIKGWLLGWFFANFEPIQDWIKSSVRPALNKLNHKYFIGARYMASALSCDKCLSFWIILGMSYNLYYAVSGAVLAYVFGKIMNSFKTNF